MVYIAQQSRNVWTRYSDTESHQRRWRSIRSNFPPWIRNAFFVITTAFVIIQTRLQLHREASQTHLHELLLMQRKVTDSKESTIHPFQHTWAHRRPWLVSVAVIDRERERVCPSLPENTPSFALLGTDGCVITGIRTRDFPTFSQHPRRVIIAPSGWTWQLHALRDVHWGRNHAAQCSGHGQRTGQLMTGLPELRSLLQIGMV